MTNPDDGYTPDWSQVKRPNGLLIILGIVFLGIWPAAYLFYKAPKLKVQFEEQWAVEASEMTVPERLENWRDHGGPQVHNHLSSNSRNGDKLPWIVTHRFDPQDGQPPEVWGIDVGKLPKALTHVEGTKMVLTLPKPTLLGRIELRSADENHVPVYTDPTEIEDPDRRLQSLAFWFLEGVPKAMEKDIPGSTFEVRIVEGAYGSG